ncbi:hypothetical protein GWI33_020831 [Rhynchophorus ferrugineus]|uniref:Uncharacterized protein n=1 Tax=Rhynchophorus ferrugineus TaxID=354439 RepID=A0A834HQ35_RHYFE|nr:hypothetical protein GWI33_020831 [Rhynchophorus ferrugineus]
MSGDAVRGVGQAGVKKCDQYEYALKCGFYFNRLSRLGGFRWTIEVRALVGWIFVGVLGRVLMKKLSGYFAALLQKYQINPL